MTVILTKVNANANVNDFDFDYDYYFVEIVCDDEFCDDDGDDVYEIFSFSSSFYVWLGMMMMKQQNVHRLISFEKKKEEQEDRHSD